MFEEVVADLDYPMYIVTVASDEERSGCLVGFATQCSIDPARFLVCLSKNNRTFRVAEASRCMAVHLIGADQGGLAELFGGTTGDEVDKFQRCEWSPGPGGVPLLKPCPNWFAGPIVASLDAGDHVAFVTEPSETHKGAAEPFLSFQAARRIDPGHEA